MTTISPLPPAPTRANTPSNLFSDQADAFVTALVAFGAQANDLADEVNASAETATTAAQSAINAPGTNATSTTGATLSTGSKTFTIQTGKAFIASQFVLIGRTGTPSNWMYGQITAHDPETGTLTVNVLQVSGSGPASAWIITVAVPPLTSGYVPIPSLTKANVGLGNVDNTSDVAKPVSTATQQALDLLTAAIATKLSRDGSAGMTGDLSIAHVGNTALILNSVGVAIAKLVVQNDGNIVLYRNTGGGDVPIWGISSNTGPFGFQVPITRAGFPVWDAGNDGAGSGNDSDTVDGYHAFQLLKSLQDVWNTDAAGIRKQFFASNGVTYNCVTGSSRWQNSSSVDIASIDEGGSFYFAGDIGQTSDGRAKSNIRTIVDGLGKVRRMRGVMFVKDGRENTGVIAQEMREVMPEVVREADDEQRTLSVTYPNLVGVLIEAVKELADQVDQLKERIA